MMIPFCRKFAAVKVLAVTADNLLVAADSGLQVHRVCENMSNVIVARAFAKRFDVVSFGSNDLTQLTLGVDRASGDLADLFGERAPALLRMIRTVFKKADAPGAKVGLCGQAPGDGRSFNRLLVETTIDSIAVTSDSLFPSNAMSPGPKATSASTPDL